MSSPERRKELRRLRDIEEQQREEEERRVADLDWYMLIEEIEDVHDAKRVLHEIVDRLDEALASRGGFPRKADDL